MTLAMDAYSLSPSIQTTPEATLGTNGEQNGCRQHLEGYLSSQSRLVLPDAGSEKFGQSTALVVSARYACFAF